MSAPIPTARPQPDQVLVDIVDYVLDYEVKSDLAYETARHCLIDTLGCGLEALSYPACTKLLGPVVAGTIGPSSLVQAGYSSASRPQPSVSIRQLRAVS